MADPLADRAIQQLVEENGLEAAKQLFDRLIRQLELPLADMPASVRAFLNDSSVMPDWADEEKLALSEQVFLDHGPSFLLFLYFKSLPTLYACANGAQVLTMTGRLDDGRTDNFEKFGRRIGETAQFLVDVMTPGGMAGDAQGIRTILRVRLIHAAIRQFLPQAHWDDAWGRPINQEDMAITLMTFCISMIEGLERFKVSITDEEAEAYFHRWKVVGHILGIDADLVPENVAAGKWLLHKILARQAASSEAGITLTQALIDFSAASIPTKLLDNAPRIFIRKLIGHDLAKMLNVRRRIGCLGIFLPTFFQNTLQAVQSLDEESEELDNMLDVISMKLVLGAVDYFDRFKGRRFEIPAQMLEKWGLMNES